MTTTSTISTLYALALLCGASQAQTTQYQPPTDTSAQASPVTAPPKAKADDSAAEASPITRERGTSASPIVPHTAIRVVLAENLDSGHLKNGQSVHGKLAADVPARGKTAALRSGTPVILTVVGTFAAGKINAAGELSLQVERVGNVAVDTDILTFRGKPGHRDLPDSAPDIGTDAGLPSGTELTFHVLGDPVAADAAPKPETGPGAVDGIMSGTAPPKDSSAGGQPTGSQGTSNIPSGTTPAPTTPATNTFGPAQNLSKPSPAPNQPAPPTQSGSGKPN